MIKTREEEIWNAIFELGLGDYNDDSSLGNDEYSGNDLQSVFYKGAYWADNHPKSSWINVNDSLPNDETKLYLIYCEAYNKNCDDIENKHHEIYLAKFDKETSSWSNIESYENYFFDVLYWMPIPELIPELPKQ